MSSVFSGINMCTLMFDINVKESEIKQCMIVLNYIIDFILIEH